MIKRILLLLGLYSLTAPVQAQSIKDFHSLSDTTLQGKPFPFEQLRGKKVLIVNTASKCGYTYQYEDLQKLAEQYADKLVVLGFPSNQFLRQEPGSNADIAEFCSINYGVTFTMMQKSEVKKGEKQNPVFKWLTDKSQNGWNEQDPTWNFCKYLIDEEGQLLKFFPSKVKPLDEEIVSAIQQNNPKQ